jgi:hypothetical protein
MPYDKRRPTGASGVRNAIDESVRCHPKSRSGFSQELFRRFEEIAVLRAQNIGAASPNIDVQLNAGAVSETVKVGASAARAEMENVSVGT